MDFIKSAVSSATKGDGQKTDAKPAEGSTNASGSSSGQMDYVDKGGFGLSSFPQDDLC